ncbi:dihydrolipoyllysine-residue acetyltransferase [Thiomicrorhabdus sp. zzn3]|uniref:dihydrolipoyllysine-residue acetyltransferase n=1 Tax=Thiomicrorhabdus sp. zzn3 TaxID=3039775 RepID=UPI002437441E|nr:dihydrolipoyllysine-residue acetyltransferase [Thiomicrorhabdus sp. zzn3]MDG6778138.1 dihydrolipoyllysine-residue acetyltransferase [Thiomicrorhabdus sp. zzn3]
MATMQFHIPDIGDFDSVDVIEVLVGEGDTVSEDDSILTLESDKATMEIPSPVNGTITKMAISVGDSVSEGTYVCDIEVAGEAAAAKAETPAEEKSAEEKPAPVAAPAPKAEAPTAPAPQPAAAPAEQKPINKQPMGAAFHASPSVRAFARKLGADLTAVSGTGPKGRIQQTDVEAFIKSVMQGQAAAPGASGAQGGMGIPPMPQIDFSQFGETETEELGRIKKISGKHLHTSWLNVPHVTQFDECDITEMDQFRKEMKANAEKQGVKLTPLVFVMKAVVKALQDFPSFNASLSPDAQSLIKKSYYNLGIAVDTPNGLVVPVVRDVDQKGIFELSRELMEISAKARDGKLGPKDMSGGTFTISSLGGIGGTQFTPIVNAPEVAIMGLSKAKMQPVWNGNEFVPRLIMPFSVSYDHRVIDGAEGVRFTTTVGQYLTDLRQLLL